MNKLIRFFLLLLIISSVVVLILFGLFPFGEQSAIERTHSFAKSDIKIINQVLEGFKKDTGRYPSNEEGLKILVEDNLQYEIEGYKQGGYLGKVPHDPWKYNYHYYLFLNNDGCPKIDIWSYGADGKPGGEGEAGDIRYLEPI